MNIDKFWDIVERVHAASGGDMKVKCSLLADALRRLSPEEVDSFDKHFSTFFYQAYSWNIWGAAHIICGGCGDDSFMDFRSTLISLGWATYEAALVNPDSLADFNIDPAWADFEGYQYVVPQVYQEMNVKEIARPMRHPKEPSGIEFDDRQMTPRFPKLVAKYGYEDVDPQLVKEQDEKRIRDEQMIVRLAALMLEAGIVSSCGLIPPPRIVAGVLRTGRSPETSGRRLTWKPIELDDGHYWGAVVRLEGMQPKDLSFRSELKDVKISSDVGASGVNDFDGWVSSLKERGFL